MNAFTTGALIILYLVLSQGIAGFIVSQTEPDFEVGECHVNLVNNETVCESVAGPTFIEAVQDVAVSGINGAPSWFNAFWVLFHAFLLVMALILIVAYFVGLIFGGAS